LVPYGWWSPPGRHKNNLQKLRMRRSCVKEHSELNQIRQHPKTNSRKFIAFHLKFPAVYWSTNGSPESPFDIGLVFRRRLLFGCRLQFLHVFTDLPSEATRAWNQLCQLFAWIRDFWNEVDYIVFEFVFVGKLRLFRRQCDMQKRCRFVCLDDSKAALADKFTHSSLSREKKWQWNLEFVQLNTNNIARICVGHL